MKFHIAQISYSLSVGDKKEQKVNPYKALSIPYGYPFSSVTYCIELAIYHRSPLRPLDLPSDKE